MFEFARARSRTGLLVFWSFALVLIASHTALASEACGDSTCPKGFTCETETLPCPDIACVEPDCKACTPSTVSSCRPAPCQADSDCDTAMVCATFTSETCTGGAQPCAAGSDCPKAADETCTPSTSHECVPRWTLPCTSAADCGAGFTCEQQQECSCSGSGGGSTPSSSGSGSSSSSSEDCSCKPSAEKACKVIVTACASDADCVSGFLCETNPNGACSQTRDGNTKCEPVDPAKVCTPPYTGLVGGGDVTRDAEGTGNVTPTVAADDGNGAKDSAGCSVAHVGGAGSAVPFLLAVGAAIGLGRRRHR